jgi:xylose isomerase
MQGDLSGAGDRMAEPLMSSIGIWAFGPLPTRFMPEGSHPEFAGESPVDRARRVAHGLHDLYDGLEFRYPYEIDEDNADDVVAAIKPMDIYCIAASSIRWGAKTARGALTNPQAEVRAEATEWNRRGIDLASRLGANYMLWMSMDGYSYPFQADYSHQWDHLLEGIADAIDHARERNVKVFLEHKAGDPGMKLYLRDVGLAIWVIHKLDRMGVDVSHVKVSMDWQHLINNGGSLAEYVELLAMEGLLGHQHANSGWGVADDDNIIGATRFMETLEIARSLRKVGYGMSGERLGVDLFPCNDDPITAARQSLIQWGFIYDLCTRLDDEALIEAQKQKDALAAYRVVFRALGMDSVAAGLVTGREPAGSRR